MPALIEVLKSHRELISSKRRYCLEGRSELLGVSVATIDRYLAKSKARAALRAISATKPGTLLLNLIILRQAGYVVEADTGFFEADMVRY